MFYNKVKIQFTFGIVSWRHQAFKHHLQCFQFITGDVESTVGRNNHRGVDLNRNFPDRFGRSEGTIQPETKAIMDWTKNHPFVISAGLHGGSLVANYPYDSNRQQVEGYSASPDDSMFKQLALAFANVR